MKKDTIHLLLLLAAIFGILIFGDADPDMRQHPQPSPPHICVDSTHNACDGRCECDGLGCGK